MRELVRSQRAELELRERTVRRTRRERTPAARVRPLRVRGGLLCFQVPRPGQLSLTAIVPASEAQAFRAKNAGARLCRPDRPGLGAPVDVNRILDIANDGTFSGARRAATLGHTNPDATADAIRGIVRAADAGTIGDQFAGELIARLGAPPLAAAQAAERAEPLTRAELAEQRRRRAAGLSDSQQLAAQIAKLGEACLPRVCFMTGNRVTGVADAINFSTITAEQAAANPAFLRFCNEADLAAAGHLNQDWGGWFTTRIAQARAAVGLGPPVATRAQIILLPGAPPPPGLPPPAAPAIVPGGLYLMRSPDGTITAQVPGWQVPARLAQGWTLL